MTLAYNSSTPQRSASGLSDQELLRAIRQRRRTMHSLQGFAYEGISIDTSRDLVSRVGDELKRLEQECSQRGLQMPG